MKKIMVKVLLILTIISIFLLNKELIMRNVKIMTGNVTNIENNDVPPEKPTINDLPSYNEYGYVYVMCTTYPNSNPLYNSSRRHSSYMSLSGSTEGFSFGEVYANDGRFGNDAPADAYPWLCDLILDKDWYLDQYNRKYSSREGTHYLLDNKPVSMTLVSDGEVWYYFTEAVPLIVWTTHEMPSYTVTYTDGVSGEKVFSDQEYEGLKEGDKTPAFTGTPMRYGYNFIGWMLNTNKSIHTIVNSVIAAADADENNNIVYTAIWAKSYAVTYTDGVSGETVFPDQGYEGLKEGDDTPTFIGTPMREGYDFIGWMLNTNKTIHTTVNSVIADADADEKNEIVYVAQWEKNPNYTMNNLSVTKTANNTTPQVGQEFKYTIIIRNSNKFGVIVDITDIISKLLTYVNSSDNGVEKDDVVTWENITIPGNGSKEVAIFVKANQATTIENTATIHLNNLNKSSNTEIVIPEKPTYTVIYKDEFNSFSSQETYALQEGTATPKFKEEPGKTQILEDGAIVPIRDGYRFIGWSKRINKVVSAEDANENYEIIYVANWQKMDTSPNEDITPPQIINKDNSNKVDNPLTEDKILKYITSGIISFLLIIIIILKNKKSIKDIFSNNKNSFF